MEYQEDMDTISAVATAAGEGGIGIIRVSGGQAKAIGSALFRGINGQVSVDFQPYHARYGHIINPVNGAVVDECLLLFMKSPQSYTREDVVEIHCHGGVASLHSILELTIAAGARLAQPGEFTKRAFLNGRLDLTQAEAVMDIIRAKTDASLRMAVKHLAGALSNKVRIIADEILAMVAQLEAAIDFPEENIEELAVETVVARTNQLIPAIKALLATARTGKILRDGLATVIIGKPNVGKSSLLNALLKEKRAIVTDVPGTTRDVIEEYVNIKGIPLKLMDTAGIRATEDIVERLGVEKSRELLATADLILLLLDSSEPLTAEDHQIIAELSGRPVIVLINKSDLPAQFDVENVQDLFNTQPIIRLSVLQEEGLHDLETAIADMVYSGQAEQSEEAFVTTVRQVNLLQEAQRSLLAVLTSAENSMPSDCLVIDLRAAWETLGEITGDTATSSLLDQIFSRFCIGK